MKRMRNIGIAAAMIMMLHVQVAFTQKIDEAKMKRDIEVAENVLSTLIKHEINQQRGFFGIDIKGNYMPGYGVTFKLPPDLSIPFMITFSGAPNPPAPVVFDSNGESFSYSFRSHSEVTEHPDDEEDDQEISLRDRQIQRRKENADSARNAYNLKLIDAAKDFLLDYGDFISQLEPNEKIVITNQGEHNRGWYFQSAKRSHLSIEATKGDISAFKLGKISREDALKRIKVVNTETVTEKAPDMELLTSIFNRLYGADLSSTFFTEDNIYYERLKDFGVVYYMQVYSSNQIDYDRFNMPTQNLTNVDRATRDKKVAELYPKFEKDIKENILEYGRTLKSLSDDESLVFNIELTKCKGCNIPTSVELAVKSKVLKEYGAGKIDKNAALGKFTIKKGNLQ